jgi:hypothetical protein
VCYRIGGDSDVAQQLLRSLSCPYRYGVLFPAENGEFRKIVLFWLLDFETEGIKEEESWLRFQE